MVKRIFKQVAAIAIAIAFVASIIFFVPNVGNTTQLSYEIIAPTSFINPNSSFYGNSAGFNLTSNVSMISYVAPVQVSSLTSGSKVSNMLQLTEAVLKSENISINYTNGVIDCMSSSKFASDMCANQNYTWLLFVSVNGGRLSLYNNEYSPSLSKIDLNSLIANTVQFVLAYQSLQSSSSSGGAPLLP